MTTPGEWDLTPEDLHKFCQDHVDWVTACLKDGDSKDWSPNMWVKVASPSGIALEVFSLHVPFNSSEDKRAAMTRCAHHVAKNRNIPLACVFSSEVWTSKMSSAGMQPKDDPDRGEGITVAVLAAKGGFSIASATIQRMNGCIAPVSFTTPSDKGNPFKFLSYFYEAWAHESVRLRRQSAVPSAN